MIGCEVQLPRTLLRPLGWSGSAQSPYQAGMPTNPPIVLAVRHPRPHAPPSPTRPSPFPPPLPPLLLLPLRLVEFLSLSLEGPLPPLGQPINCPLSPLFGLSWLRWPRSSALQRALTPWVAQAAVQEGTEGSPGRRQRRHAPGPGRGSRYMPRL